MGCGLKFFPNYTNLTVLMKDQKKELNLTLEQFIAAAEAMLDGVIAINQNNEIL